MNYQTKLTGQNIVLPKEWKNIKVFIRETEDTIIIKKIQEPEFWTTWQKMKPIAKGISKKDITKAILSVRKAKK